MAFVPYFTLGVCLYGLAERRTVARVSGVFISSVLSALHFSRYIQGKVEIGPVWLHDLVTPTHLATMSSFILIPPLVYFLGKVRTSKRAAEIDRRFGDLTYPLYLNHFSVLVIAYSLNRRFSGVTLVVCASSIALSTLLAASIERPPTRMRDRIRGQTLEFYAVPASGPASALKIQSGSSCDRPHGEQR